MKKLHTDDFLSLSFEVLTNSKEKRSLSKIAKTYDFPSVEAMNEYAKSKNGYIYQSEMGFGEHCNFPNCKEFVSFLSRNDFTTKGSKKDTSRYLCAKHKKAKFCEGGCDSWFIGNGEVCEVCENNYKEFSKYQKQKEVDEWDQQSDEIWIKAQPKLRWFHFKLFQVWYRDGVKNFSQACDTAGIKKTMQDYILKDLLDWKILYQSGSGLTLIKNAKNIDKPVAAMKSVFDSPRERQVYVTLVSEHPAKLVLPNQALSSFIDFQLIKQALTQEESTYFFKARVDFLLVHPFNLYPLLAIEIDSTYHNSDEAVNRDGMKDRILELAQVPFQRMYRPEEK